MTGAQIVVALFFALLIAGLIYVSIEDWIKCQYRDAALWYYRQRRHDDDVAEAMQLIDRLYQSARGAVDHEVARPD